MSANAKYREKNALSENIRDLLFPIFTSYKYICIELLAKYNPKYIFRVHAVKIILRNIITQLYMLSVYLLCIIACMHRSVYTMHKYNSKLHLCTY